MKGRIISFLFLLYSFLYVHGQVSYEVIDVERTKCVGGFPNTVYFDDGLRDIEDIFFSDYGSTYHYQYWTFAKYIFPTADDAFYNRNAYPRDRIAKNIPIEFISNPFIVYARLEENKTSADRIKKIVRITYNYSLRPGGRNNYDLFGCKLENDIYQYNLNKVIDELYSNQPIYKYSFYTSYGNAQSKINPINKTDWNNYTTDDNQNQLFIRIDFSEDYQYYTNCFGIYSINLKVPNIHLYLPDDTPKFCGIPFELFAPFDKNNVYQFSDFEWYFDNQLKSSSESVIIDDIGEWTVYFNLNKTCREKYTFNVVWDDGEGVISNVKKSGRNYIIETFKTKYPLEFSIDQINWQSSPIFKIDDDSKFSFYFKSRGCVFGPYEYYFNDIVDFFTPNGDGINDVWKINNTYLRDEYYIQIFNRYGKIVKEGPIKEVNLWNGKVNGFGLVTDTYWYIIKENDKKVMEGNVLIKNK